MKKDIINLILTLCLTTIAFSFVACMSVGVGLALVTTPFTKVLLEEHHFIDYSIFIFGAFCVITAFFFPVITTKLFLDTNWSKYTSN